MSPTVITIAFDGMNRVGKGTQIGLLHHLLTEHHIPNVMLRGDGSRTGLGLQPGDPYDPWWQSFHDRQLMAPSREHRFALWNQAADRLHKEFRQWRDERLPEALDQSGHNIGALLLDRSLISRLSLVWDEREGRIEPDGYYGELPDLLIHLSATQAALINRLDPDDPKYAFRRGLLVHTYHIYKEVLQNLPPHIRHLVTAVNGEASIEIVHQEVCRIINRQFLIWLPL